MKGHNLAFPREKLLWENFAARVTSARARKLLLELFFSCQLSLHKAMNSPSTNTSTPSAPAPQAAASTPYTEPKEVIGWGYAQANGKSNGVTYTGEKTDNGEPIFLRNDATGIPK